MSRIQIEDVCLWPAHIDGNTDLRDRLLGLNDGEIVILRLGSVSGAFVKMNKGKNLNPTPGLRPACDTTKDWWQKKFTTQKGEWIEITEVLP